MPTYDEIYMEDTGKRRHVKMLMNGAHNGEGKAMWCVIIGALLFLWLVRHGFRGVSSGGLMVGVK